MSDLIKDLKLTRERMATIEEIDILSGVAGALPDGMVDGALWLARQKVQGMK